MRTDSVSLAAVGPRAERRIVERTQGHLFRFLRALHAEGLSVPAHKELDFLAGIDELAPSNIGQLYWVGVATLVTSETARPAFDEVFRRFFGGSREALIAADELPEPDERDERDEEQSTAPGESGDDGFGQDIGGSGLRASRTSPQIPKRFDGTTAAARSLMHEISGELPGAVPVTRSRRHRPGRQRHRVDLRAIYLEARRTQGEIVRLRWRHPPARPRRILVLIDVSGSMKQHSPDYLRFAHTVVATCPRAEVFTFGTQLTRITTSLRHPDVDIALAALSRVVLDADGGTRIGDSLQEFLGNGRFTTMSRDGLVLVLSDGLERGDCTAMTRAVRRLSRLSYRLMWWSPLACDPAYQPLTRGMAAVVGDLNALAGVRDLETALRTVRDWSSHSIVPHPPRRSRG